MSFPTVDDINTASYQLLELLEVRNESKSPPQLQAPVKPLFGIGEPIDLTDSFVESGGITEYISDEWDNVTSVSHSLDGKVYRLNIKNYQFLKAIAEKFLEQNNHFLVADAKFAEQQIFNWLIDVNKQKRIGLNLLPFLENRLYEEIQPYTFYFKVHHIGIESEIRFADIIIFPFTEAYLRLNYDKLSLEKQNDWNEYKQAFAGVINSVVAAVEVKAVDSMAETIAETKAARAINALKCFLFPEAISRKYYLFDLEFKTAPPSMTTFVTKYNAQGDMRLTMKNLGGVPIEFTTNLLQRLESMGLSLLDSFLLSHQPSPFNYLITRAIDHLGNAFSVRDLHRRAVELVSVFELFLNYDNKSGAKPQTYLIRNILPHLLPVKIREEGKKNVQLLYKIRNRYLHNGHRLSFDVKDLYFMHVFAFNFLKMMIKLSKQLIKKEDFFKHFSIVH